MTEPPAAPVAPPSRRVRVGDLAFAALALAAASGVALALAWDVRRPYDSLSNLLLVNPSAAWFRNVHYWTAQVLLLGGLWHAWDTVRRGGDRTMKPGVWARAALSLPLVGFVMVSGFILKGDLEGTQAWRIVTALLGSLPIVGPLLATMAVGPVGDHQIIYVHHAATATLLLWIVSAEHGRRVWPRLRHTAPVLAVTGAIALVVSPALHDGLDGVVKGPWSFLGVQEALHWTALAWPVLLAGALATLALASLPLLPARWRRAVAMGLAAGLGIYAALTLTGAFWRGPQWALGPSWTSWRASLVVAPVYRTWVAGAATVRAGGAPSVAGRREGCLVCHPRVTGLSASHRPDALGCVSCHGGYAFTLDAGVAHRAMTRVPGNLADADRSCGTSACHPSPVARVRTSLMETMTGVREIDEAVVGAGADSHFGQLCASCHLGAEKTAFGPVTESSRGGGCNACHLAYDAGATRALTEYAARQGRPRTPPAQHPDLTARVTDDHCFGCHSRSGRISTSYAGWHETTLERAPEGDGGHWRTLDDGRVFRRMPPDVHAAAGLACIDCHTARETMGDGETHARKAEAVVVQCADCHAAAPLRSVAPGETDAETQRVLSLRPAPRPDERLVVTAQGGQALTATRVDRAGSAWLVPKLGGERRPMKAPTEACRGTAHARLTCSACHSAWAPQCIGCHTRFDPDGRGVDHRTGTDVAGEWLETASDLLADEPALGVRTLKGADGRARETIDTVVPGMILTVTGPSAAGRPATGRFARLFARLAPHTTAARARSCRSCHLEPNALGYGRGRLDYQRVARTGTWQFTPRFPGRAEDGLPADAWIPFRGTPAGRASTGPDVRPFTPDEQARVLSVGACLTCHADTSAAMNRALGHLADADRACRRR